MTAETPQRDVIDLSAPKAKTAAAPARTPATPDEAARAVSPPPGDISQEELARITDDVVSALKTVYDPEIPVDIYELGLIYKVDLEEDRTLKVQMSLTAPGCPVAGEMPGWVQEAVEKVDGVDRALVDLTFEPPWTPDRMSDEARLALNMF
jgi:FeS assembly SUF system protein